MQNTEFYESNINGYRLSSFLGSGGMGDVYLGIHTGTGHKVAIKILNNPEFEQRFRNEMEVLARIQHPSITSFHDIGKVGQNTCIIMEYAGGVTLHELIRRQGKLNYDQAANIFRQMLEGVGFVHANNIIHRDIKPGNIKVDDNGRVKILDFGIAKADFSEHLTRTGEAIGTFQYMSPEQLRGKPDKRSDIWSLGVTFYEMLTGYQPFNSKELYTLKEQIKKGQYTPVTTMNSTVPPHIEKVIGRCLKLNPDHRYQSAEELLYDIDNASSGKTTIFGKIDPSRTRVVEPSRPVDSPSGNIGKKPEPIRTKQPNRKMPMVATILLLVVSLGGFAWWNLSSDTKISPDEIGIEVYSTVPGATISVDGGRSHKLPYIIKGEKGEKVLVVVEAKGHRPKRQEVNFSNYTPGKIRPTYIDPD